MIKICIGVLEVVGSSGGFVFCLYIVYCCCVMILFWLCKFFGWCVNVLGVKLLNKEMVVFESVKVRLVVE